MHKFCQAVIAGAAVLLAGERSPAQTLAQLPPIVAQTIRAAEESCIDAIDKTQQPKYQLDEVVYQVSLSGPGTRDYVVSMRNFHCSGRALPLCSVSGFCDFHHFLNPTLWLVHGSAKGADVACYPQSLRQWRPIGRLRRPLQSVG